MVREKANPNDDPDVGIQKCLVKLVDIVDSGLTTVEAKGNSMRTPTKEDRDLDTVDMAKRHMIDLLKTFGEIGIDILCVLR